MPESWDEGDIRLAIFVVALIVFALFEALLPEAKRKYARFHRWFTNVSIVVIATLLTRVALPLLAVDAALWAKSESLGLFNALPIPHWLAVVAAVMLLDLLIYGQHVLTHYVPLLWALHKVHHSDREIDVTTALRFHPLEIILSMMLKILAVTLLGAPALAVIIFEILLSTTAMFNHSNLHFSPALDNVLRKVIVTPNMHRIHHSLVKDEHNRNFGFSFSLWDRLFRTYRDRPQQTYSSMSIGLVEYQKTGPEKLFWSLLLPFKRPAKQH